MNFNFIKSEFIRLKDSSFKTNFFLNEDKFSLISKNKNIQFFTTDEGCYFLIEDIHFYRFYFITKNLEDLNSFLKNNIVEKKETITCELIGNQNYLEPLLNCFNRANFYEYTSLRRMSKLKSKQLEITISRNIHLLGLDRKHELLNLFNTYFDKFAEQLPTIDELEGLINQKCVYYYTDNNEIQGFIIFEIQGFTSHLRYWFVHPSYRERKIGTLLINMFFNKGIDVKRELFWVIESNDNAIKRYKHYGFNSENMFNKVLINKKIKYEK